jgi:HSP90 family molecular chaperone
MDLIINSLYLDRDIFLRELVSNAANACDKKGFLALTEELEVSLPQIKIRANLDDTTLILEDSRVGMTKDKIVNNLGNIAQSGTHAFAQALGDICLLSCVPATRWLVVVCSSQLCCE